MKHPKVYTKVAAHVRVCMSLMFICVSESHVYVFVFPHQLHFCPMTATVTEYSCHTRYSWIRYVLMGGLTIYRNLSELSSIPVLDLLEGWFLNLYARLICSLLFKFLDKSSRYFVPAIPACRNHLIKWLPVFALRTNLFLQI
jgi:hypothetical protein